MSPMDFQIPEVRQFRAPAVPPGLVVRIILIVVAIALSFSTWFTVEPEEAGIVLRFGRFVRQVPPGLHLKLPIPIEQVIKVPVERQLKEEFGFRTQEAGVRTTYSTEDLSAGGASTTGGSRWRQPSLRGSSSGRSAV